MRYYVLAPTGERYGPADTATLNEWAAGGRVFPSSRLVEEMSGAVVAASSVAGLIFPQQAPFAPSPGPIQPPTPVSPYPRPSAPGGPYQQPPTPGSGYTPRMGSSLSGQDGKNDLWIAFGMVLVSPVLSLFCIYGFTTALFGIAASWRAVQRGQKIAILPLVLNCLCLGFWAISRFVFRHWLFDRQY